MSKKLTMAVEQESETVSPPTVADLHVVQRDDGKYQLGIHDDAPGPFESREFAAAVAGKPPSPPNGSKKGDDG